MAMLQCDPIVKNSSMTDIPNNLCPISYASKTLSETESNYSNIERELLGVVFSMTHFKTFYLWQTSYYYLRSQASSIIVQEVSCQFFSTFIKNALTNFRL